MFFFPGGKYYSIKGKTKIDINNNGCEESDVNCSNLKYKIKHNSTTSNHLTNINGSYNLLLAEGTYYLKPLGIENIESYNIKLQTQ